MRVGLALMTALGIVAPVNASPAVIDRLPGKDRPALAQALRYREVIPLERAAASLRRFLHEPGADVTLRGFGFRALYPTEQVYLYDFSAGAGDRAGRYTVRGDNGEVARFDQEASPWPGSEPAAETEDDESPVTITLSEARGIAAQFLRVNYPGWTRGQWQLYPVTETRNAVIMLAWNQVRGPAGALGSCELEVEVSARTRQVTAFRFPRVLGPSVLSPRFNREQAQRIAAQVAPYDPAQHPLNKPRLEIGQANGIDLGMSYFFCQLSATTHDGSCAGSLAHLFVDALTGQAQVELPIGLGPKLRANRRPVPAKLLPTVNLRSTSGKYPLTLRAAAMSFHKNRLWVPARLLGQVVAPVRVAEVDGNLQIRHGERVVSGPAVGARRVRKNWWVPLRAVGDRLDWQVTWTASPRVVTISHPGAAWNRLKTE